MQNNPTATVHVSGLQPPILPPMAPPPKLNNSVLRSDNMTIIAPSTTPSTNTFVFTSTSSISGPVPLINQESYYGLIETPQDAVLVIQAARCGLLPRVRSRLSDRERKAIRSGSVFVFCEAESRICRWTDGKAWSPSRISGDFLVYRELAMSASNNSNSKSVQKEVLLTCGLIKKTLSLQPQAVHFSESFHLVTYFREEDAAQLASLAPSQNTLLLTALNLSTLHFTDDLHGNSFNNGIMENRSILDPSSLNLPPLKALDPTPSIVMPRVKNNHSPSSHLATLIPSIFSSAPSRPLLPPLTNMRLSIDNKNNNNEGGKDSEGGVNAEDGLLFTHFLTSLHASSHPGSPPNSDNNDEQQFKSTENGIQEDTCYGVQLRTAKSTSNRSIPAAHVNNSVGMTVSSPAGTLIVHESTNGGSSGNNGGFYLGSETDEAAMLLLEGVASSPLHMPTGGERGNHVIRTGRRRKLHR